MQICPLLSVKVQTKETGVKARLHIWFPHAFSAWRCNFLLLTLIEQNQGKL
jgi:hypothetical protein